MESAGVDRHLQILIAEDNDESYLLLATYLQAHRVAHASNRREAVEMARHGGYDLLFMDIKMPVLDGYRATREIRQRETSTRSPRMPVLTLSTHDLLSQRRLGALAGCSGCLEKPVRKPVVLEAVRRYARAAKV